MAPLAFQTSEEGGASRYSDRPVTVSGRGGVTSDLEGRMRTLICLEWVSSSSGNDDVQARVVVAGRGEGDTQHKRG